MRVFVTGATGFVGSAVVENLLEAGHQVVGLVRSEAGADALAARGAGVLRGDLEDHDSLRRGADGADAVIHAAFIHDFSAFARSCEIDRRAIGAIGAALQGTARPLLVTSGLALVAPGRPATEADIPPAATAAYPRASEAAALELAAGGVNAAVVRLPASVHGTGDHGFVPFLIGLAREKGVSAYVGDGQNRWPAVHRRDAAQLYRLGVENAEAGATYHAIAEDGIRFRDIADAIGRRLGVPVRGVTPEAAPAHFSWMAHFAAMDMPASSARTRAALGWTPREIGLFADMAHAGYFPA
jgi:nucleoside-diphosphate-sugar epimerase